MNHEERVELFQQYNRGQITLEEYRRIVGTKIQPVEKPINKTKLIKRTGCGKCRKKQ